MDTMNLSTKVNEGKVEECTLDITGSVTYNLTYETHFRAFNSDVDRLNAVFDAVRERKREFQGDFGYGVMVLVSEGKLTLSDIFALAAKELAS